MVSKALREAYNLGQRYWQQADSEYISQHKKADDTRAKFLALVEETCAALAAGQATAAPAGAAEELALTRHTNLAVVQRLQAKINALEAELEASRKAESQVRSYADDLDRRAQYDADNLADACGGYGGERI